MTTATELGWILSLEINLIRVLISAGTVDRGLRTAVLCLRALSATA